MDKLRSIKIKGIPLWQIGIGAVVVLAISAGAFSQTAGKEKKPPEINTLTALEKVVQTSELSTYTAVYNGIAEIMNETNPENVDCYVAYEAKVNAGIDLEKVKISMEGTLITIDIPDVIITDLLIDEESIDILYYNEKRNQMGIMETALTACRQDVKEESEHQAAIYVFAEQNAENILKALTMPFIEQLGEDYTLEIN